MIDTCVYLNYYFDETGRFVDFGDEARNLLEKVRQGEYGLIVSDHLEYQLKDKLGERYSEYLEFKQEISENQTLVEVEVELQDKNAARAFDTEFEDALHFQLACKGGADYLVTRNIEHFGCLDGVNNVFIRLPEHMGVF